MVYSFYDPDLHRDSLGTHMILDHIDIAREGGHVVRIALSGTGTNNTFAIDQTEPREIMYQLDFSEFGEITEFTPPPACGGLPRSIWSQMKDQVQGWHMAIGP